MTTQEARAILNSTGPLCESNEACEARRVLYPEAITLEEYERIVEQAWAKYKLIETAALAEFEKIEAAALAKLESDK